MPHPTKTAVLVGEALALATRISDFPRDELKFLVESKRVDSTPSTPSQDLANLLPLREHQVLRRLDVQPICGT